MMTTPAIAIVSAISLMLSAQARSIREKEAISDVQRVLASQLDAELPRKPLADWFRRVVGPQAKVNWELNDCGEQTGTASDRERDLPVCVGVRGALPDGRQVFADLIVGTVRKGMNGRVSVYQAGILRGDQVDTIRRLRDLPERLRVSSPR